VYFINDSHEVAVIRKSNQTFKKFIKDFNKKEKDMKMENTKTYHIHRRLLKKIIQKT